MCHVTRSVCCMLSNRVLTRLSWPQGIAWRTPRMLGRLKSVAESAKVSPAVTCGASTRHPGSGSPMAGWQVKLSSVDRVVISLPLADRQGRPIQAPLTRGRLDRMAQPLFKRMRQAIDAACWSVRLHFALVLAPLADHCLARCA